MVSIVAKAVLAGCLSASAGALQVVSKDVPISRGADEGRTSPRVVEEVDMFTEYVAHHGRDYEVGSAEYSMRLALFTKRAAEVVRQNSKPDRWWTAGLNKFSDRTEEEMKAYRGYKKKKKGRKSKGHSSSCHSKDIDADDLPKNSHSWLNLHNSFVRDQLQCGSCWAVTASTVLGWHSEIHSTNRSFSTQEIVDCTPDPHACGGTGGCEGATVELAFQYAMAKGLREPSEYGSYEASDKECDWNPGKHTHPTMKYLTENLASDCGFEKARHNAAGLAFGMYGWMILEQNKMLPLMQAVHKRGPVAVALAANDISSYTSGIFNSCESWTVNHAVTLIGYGQEKRKKYWLVQNSWGEGWGDEGRIKIKREKDEEANCGEDTAPQEGIACEGEDEPVTVCGTCGILYDSVMPMFRKV